MSTVMKKQHHNLNFFPYLAFTVFVSVPLLSQIKTVQAGRNFVVDKILGLRLIIASCLLLSLVSCSIHEEFQLSPQDIDNLTKKLTIPNQEEYSQKIADLDRVIKRNPQDAKAYNNRGNIYTEMEQYPQAIADFNQAIKLDPKFVDAYDNRGIIYRRQEQYPQAIADFNQAIKLNPKFAGAYLDRGVSYADEKENAKAIADFNQAVKLNPKMALAYYNRGVFYNSQEQYPQAKAELEKAKKLFHAQNDTSGYQQTMEFLQQVESNQRNTEKENQK
jgi:tetratricopeptide (TPR) repeat protein